MNNKFIPIEKEIENYVNKNYEEKLNLIRKLSRDVTYNDDYQIKINDNKFLNIILDNIYNLLNNKDIENINNHLTYTRLFFMFFHNALGNDTKIQQNIFNNIFINDYNKLTYILNIYIKDLKIQKFCLGIIYKLFFLNTFILINLLNQNHYKIFINIIENIEYNLDVKNDNDKNEINDWLNIIFEYIIKNEEQIINLNNKTFLEYILINITNDNNNIIILEIIRDIIDFAKTKKILLISLKNLKILCDIFLNSINSFEILLNKYNLLENWEQFSNLKEVQLYNKIFICLIDIFSVILTTDDLNNEDYRKLIFNNLNDINFLKKILKILKITDELYDKIFIRDKGIKQEDLNKIPKLNINNIFSGFQTNLLKFLSNFCYKNEYIKKYYIENPLEFYYLLNHLKMDKCNLFKKEWTVLMIKSLCENCYGIQKLIIELKPLDMDPLLKDYIINKGKQKVNFENSNEKNIYFDMLQKK